MENDFQERLAFAKQNLNLDWSRVIFCNQTQINGIGVMGLLTEYGLGNQIVLTEYINTNVQYINAIKKWIHLSRIKEMISYSQR